MFNQTHNKYAGQAQGTLNRTSVWMYLLLLVILIAGVIYAIPNLFGYDPAVQISSSTPGVSLNNNTVSAVKSALNKEKIAFKSVAIDNKKVLVRFNNINQQLEAKNKLLPDLGNQYIVATMSAAATPAWLSVLNARPMRLGLDLRGGMSLLIQVDIDGVIKQRERNGVRDLAQALRTKNIRYTQLIPSSSGITIHFSNQQARTAANAILSSDNQFSQYVWQKSDANKGLYSLVGRLSPQAILKIRQYTMTQTINTLTRRVNELGVSEAQVQQAGSDRISVDLPGVSDATEAQNILGKTATIQTHLVDLQNDAQQAQRSGVVPAGDLLFKDKNGQPILLKNDVVLSGDNITSASSGFDQAGQAQVSIKVSGGAQTKLYNTTSENIGKPMAVVYSETKSQVSKPSQAGKSPKVTYHTTNTVINVATIQSAFGSAFVITGLNSVAEAQQLALLLRAGSLPANLAILSERQVGPSMGAKNITHGKLSIAVGLILVILFMALYYRGMGLIANIALLINLILIVAIMSLLGAVLTFPGIASLVLTIGMAVDGNVLIFERIREELRGGASVQSAIHAGYNRAIITIVDAQLTTLIAAAVLFGIGSGPIQGFAIVLTIGLFTSMLTAITYTRAMVNFLFGGRQLDQLSIGIKRQSS